MTGLSAGLHEKINLISLSIVTLNPECMNEDKSVTYSIGFWSATLSFIFATGYIVFQGAQWAGLTPSPWHLLTLTFPSFWLALAFVVLMVAVYNYAPGKAKIWAQIALSFAIMYATLNAAVYFLQMTTVFPAMLAGQAERVAFIELNFGTFIYAFDVLGYSLMSLATLFAAPVFAGDGIEKWTRRFLSANGVLTPALLLQLNFPTFPIAGLWAITFPVSCVLLAVFFRRKLSAV
jgi:hypothetical protein